MTSSQHAATPGAINSILKATKLRRDPFFLWEWYFALEHLTPSSFFVCLRQTGLLVVYVINAGISYLSYLEAKRVGQVSSATTTPLSLMRLVSILKPGSKGLLVHLMGGRWRYSGGVHCLELERNNAWKFGGASGPFWRLIQTAY